MKSSSLVPQILTPFNYFDWREDMQIALCKLGLYRMKMGRENEPQQYVEKNKFSNQLHVHSYLPGSFVPCWLRNPNEYWENIESLFGKQDDIRGHTLANELIGLQTNSFESIQQFFTKYKSLLLQCKQCGLERKYEQLVFASTEKDWIWLLILYLYIPFWKRFHP